MTRSQVERLLGHFRLAPNASRWWIIAVTRAPSLRSALGREREFKLRHYRTRLVPGCPEPSHRGSSAIGGLKRIGPPHSSGTTWSFGNQAGTDCFARSKDTGAPVGSR